MEKNRYSIFLVDDDDMYLESIKHHLHKTFHNSLNIKCFSTGEECLNNLHHNPDIIVLDYFLDGNNTQLKSGVEVMKKIKEHNQDVPIVMLTKNDSVEVAINTIKNGAYEFIVKSESAHLRLENVMSNIMKKIHLSAWAKNQKKFAIIVALIFGLIYAISLIAWVIIGQQSN